MSLGMIVIFVWVVTTAAAACFFVKRIDQRKPNAVWGGPRQLIWHGLAAIVIAAAYVFLSSAFEGRMTLPSKGLQSQYIYLQAQPVAFWLVLSVYFALTASFSAILSASTYLVLRSSRVRT